MTTIKLDGALPAGEYTLVPVGQPAPFTASIAAAPMSLPAGGGQVTLTWVTSGDVDVVTRTGVNGKIAVVPFTGSAVTAPLTKTTTFYLRATDKAGNEARAQTTVTVAQVVTCGPGEVMVLGDITADEAFYRGQLWPSNAQFVYASGDRGIAIQFFADGARFPGGMEIKCINEKQPTTANEWVISECPHSFVPVGNRPMWGNSMQAGVMIGGTANSILTRIGPPGTLVKSYEALLSPVRVYYLNFRDYNQPRGTVSSQFVVVARTD